MLSMIASGAAILVSMGFGLALLNALPGAAQRFPANTAAGRADIFALRNEAAHLSIDMLATPCRRGFFAGVLFFSLAVSLRLARQYYPQIFGCMP